MNQVVVFVLDTSRGLPAEGVHVQLNGVSAGGRETLVSGITDVHGCINDLGWMPEGVYSLIYDTRAYFRQQEEEPFHPRIQIDFTVSPNPELDRYVLSLLLGAHAYTTYRGS